MRIGILTDFLDYGASGIGNYVQNLVEKILEIDKKNEYTLIHTQKNENRLYEKARDIILPPFILPPKMILRKNLLLPNMVKKEGFDLIHETTQITPSLMRLQSKRVLTVHDIIPVAQPHGMLWGKYQKHILTRACGNADRIIAVSEHTKKDLIKYLGIPEEKISVVYYGLDEVFKPEGERKKDEIKNKYGIETPFILYVGSFEVRKNILLLIRAFSEVKKKGVEHKLVLAGEKSHEYKKIKEMVGEIGLEGKVKFTGYIPKEDLPALYNLADVFVYPSLYEGFGLPPLEAMACGTPVVSSNRSSLPEVIDDAGLMINPTNVGELTDAITNVLTDESLKQELIKKGLKRAKEFSWEDAAGKTLKVYEEAIGL